MPLIKDLDVTITYKVGYGDVDMPQDVYDEIIQAQDNLEPIEMHSQKYPKAAEFLLKEIEPSDCTDWEAEIINCIT